MFIAIIMENFETAEEEKRQRQVQDYLNKNDTMILEDAPIASRWNVFRYLKPKPKGLAVDNMPSGLVLSTQKEYVREFLVDSNRGNAIPVEQVSQLKTTMKGMIWINELKIAFAVAAIYQNHRRRPVLYIPSFCQRFLQQHLAEF
jgi:hypothetical protein